MPRFSNPLESAWRGWLGFFVSSLDAMYWGTPYEYLHRPARRCRRATINAKLLIHAEIGSVAGLDEREKRKEERGASATQTRGLVPPSSFLFTPSPSPPELSHSRPRQSLDP